MNRIYFLLMLMIIMFLGHNVACGEPTEGGGRVIEFKQLNLQGTIQRPSASFFMGRRKLKFKGLVPKKSFIREIKNSVKKSPF